MTRSSAVSTSRHYALNRRVAVILGLALAFTGLAWGFLGVSSARAAYGVVPGSFSTTFTNQAGETYTQAGGHPYAMSTDFALNTRDNGEGFQIPDGNIKDATVDLPAGVVANPTVVSTCEGPQLDAFTCPGGSQVGVVKLELQALGSEDFEYEVGVYNMKPSHNEVAALGFLVVAAPVRIVASVRTGGDYGLRASLSDISETYDLLKSKITLWGVPADPSHDPERGILCEFGGCYLGGESAGMEPQAYLTMPTDCSHGPFVSTLQSDSWQDPTQVSTDTAFSPAVTGCDALRFEPSIAVTPEVDQAAVPSGYSVDVHVPQHTNPQALGTPELRKAVVALPTGVAVSPSSAGGLQGCTDEQVALASAAEASCPEASKIGDVTIDTPVLSEPLTGAVYVGSQTATQLLRIFLVAHGPGGLLVKLAGNVDPDPVTGRLTAIFENNPQLPFSDLKLTFKTGPRAPLVNPTACGQYTTTTELTSWVGGAPATPSSSFGIDQGCATGGFAPSLDAGTVSNQAGAFSPFTLTLARSDGEQALGSITVRTPPGLLGVLKNVVQCPEPQAAQGACGTGSLIGHTTVGAGAGSNPFYLGGQVFLTGPYKGAPFGLSIVVPAIAGPFNLGTVVVRAAISVDPKTAALTISSDPLPTILQGIPLDIRTVNVTVDRTGFMFNPTSCAALMVGATVSSAQGASAVDSSHFQAANCASLAFKPRFSASLAGKSSRASGAALDVKISSGAGQANIGRVAVSLPKALPSRLTTIQKACPQATFAANPASCPVGSLVGTGTAVTPILAHALTGPAYLVSHGGAAFPDLVVVLRGEGITVDLTGAIDITKAGITSSTFNNVPDVPISSFELKLPTGSHSALTANLPASAKGSFCGQSLTMPTSVTGQNGENIKQATKLTVTDCTTAKKKTAAKQTTKTAKRSSAGQSNVDRRGSK